MITIFRGALVEMDAFALVLNLIRTMPVNKPADITPGTHEVANRLKDVNVFQMESGQTQRLGDLWEKADAPVVFVMFRRWG